MLFFSFLVFAHEESMYIAGFDYMLTEISHEPLIGSISRLHGFSKGDEKFPMQSRANVGNLISQMISLHACFRGYPFFNMLLGSMALDP